MNLIPPRSPKKVPVSVCWSDSQEMVSLCIQPLLLPKFHCLVGNRLPQNAFAVLSSVRVSWLISIKLHNTLNTPSFREVDCPFYTSRIFLCPTPPYFRPRKYRYIKFDQIESKENTCRLCKHSSHIGKLESHCSNIGFFMSEGDSIRDSMITYQDNFYILPIF